MCCYNNNTHHRQALCTDVDVFGEQVDGCREHYEARQLALLARCLREKKDTTSRAIGERVRVAKSGVSFYKGVERVSGCCGNNNISSVSIMPKVNLLSHDSQKCVLFIQVSGMLES